MKKFISFIFVLLTLLWALPAIAQRANPQTVTRIRGASNNLANIASVRALTLTYPVTTWGLHTNSSTYFYDGATFRWWLGATIGDAMPAAPLAPYVIALGTYYDGTQYRRLLGGDMADNLAAAQTLPWVGAYNLFFDGTNHRRWLGKTMNTSDVVITTTAPWVGSFGYSLNIDEAPAVWARDTVEVADGADIVATVEASHDFALNYVWDGTDWKVLGADANGDITVNQTTATPGNDRLQDGDSTVLADVLDAHADGLALTLNGLSVSAVTMLYNGATLDMARAGAVGEMQVTDVAVRPGEDAGNDWRKSKKEEIAVRAGPVIAGTAVTDASAEVCPSTYVLNLPNWSVWVKNAGGGAADAFTDVDVQISYDGTNWSSLASTDCDTLAAGVSARCNKGTGESAAYIKVIVDVAGGDTTTADCVVQGNKN